MNSTCFWAILSVEDLQFIHASSLHDKLKGLSLFDIIHPEEISLAKRDLNKFVDSNVLGGSVTRCRLRDYTNNNNFTTTPSPSWIVVDIIMYVATENLVLTFFHRQCSSKKSVCGDYNFSITTTAVAAAKRDAIIRDLKRQQRQHQSSFLLSNNKTRTAASSEYPYNNAANSSPHQFFHILDNRTKSVLLSWPDHYPNEIYNNGAQMMNFLNNNILVRPLSSSSSELISCFHCVQKPIRINASGQKVHSLVIEYGSISFVLTHVEKVKKLLTLSLPSSPMYIYSNSSNSKQQRTNIDPQQEEQQQDHPLYSRSRHHHPYHYGRTSAPTSPIKRHRTSTSSSGSSSSSSSSSSNATTSNITHAKQSVIKLANLLSPAVNTSANNNHNKQELFNHNQYHHQQRNHCQSCGTNSSPEWRRGPTGHKTLCNACGLRYSRSVARQGKKMAVAATNNQQTFQQQQQKKPRSTSPQLLSSSCSSLPSSLDHHQQRKQPFHLSELLISPSSSAYNSNNSHHHHNTGYSILH